MEKIDIRKKDGVETFKTLWIRDSFEKLRANPDLKDITDEELATYLIGKYSERYVSEGRLFNNVTNKNEKMTQEQFVNMYLNEPYILSGYSTLYQNQDNSVNISSAALENLGELRNINKEKMKNSEHGSDAYTYYRILQLTYKVLMNSYYGILGEKNSVFYNSYVQNSITMTAQDLITTSIIGMENFLTNNVPFNDTSDVITFIFNVKDEPKMFNIMDYVDAGISKDELLQYLINHKTDDAEIDWEIIAPYIDTLDIETRTRIYYKNRVLDLISNNSWFKSKLEKLVQYKYGEKPEEAMKPLLEEFKSRVLDFCYYDYLIEDRYRRAMKHKRKSIIVIDTDSNFINLHEYIESVTSMLKLDKTNEEQQMTVMNIFVDIVTDSLKLLFWLLTTNMGLVDRAKPIINMKSEFVYKRILLTRNKKSLKKLYEQNIINIIKIWGAYELFR